MSHTHARPTHHIPPIRTIGTTPLGLLIFLAFTRGSASAAQPRASWQNPVGIPGGGWGKARPWGFPEGKRRSPVLRRFRMGKLVHAHLRPPHPRPFAVPRPQRQRRCVLQPGVAPSAALPRVWGRRSHQPQGGCAEGSNGWHPPSLLAFVRPRSQFSPLPSTEGANHTAPGNWASKQFEA